MTRPKTYTFEVTIGHSCDEWWEEVAAMTPAKAHEEVRQEVERQLSDAFYGRVEVRSLPGHGASAEGGL
jgi:hypothetical protein